MQDVLTDHLWQTVIFLSLRNTHKVLFLNIPPLLCRFSALLAAGWFCHKLWWQLVRIDKIIDDFLQLAQAPADFKAIVDILLRRQLGDECLHSLLHGDLLLSALVVDKELARYAFNRFLNACLGLED